VYDAFNKEIFVISPTRTFLHERSVYADTIDDNKIRGVLTFRENTVVVDIQIRRRNNNREYICVYGFSFIGNMTRCFENCCIFVHTHAYV